MLYNVQQGDLVIPVSTQASNSIDVSGAKAVTIYSPAALTGTVRLQASDDDVTFYDVKSGGNDVTIGVNAALPLGEIGSRYLRLFSDAAEAVERTFKATMQEEY